MINLSLEIKEVEMILAALFKGQYDIVAPVVEKIKTQAVPQVAEIQAKEQNELKAEDGQS